MGNNPVEVRILLFARCFDGETGRHTHLKNERRKAWGFDSPSEHFQKSPDGGTVDAAGLNPAAFLA